jgi:hypothetical protein
VAEAAAVGVAAAGQAEEAVAALRQLLPVQVPVQVPVQAEVEAVAFPVTGGSDL